MGMPLEIDSQNALDSRGTFAAWVARLGLLGLLTLGFLVVCSSAQGQVTATWTGGGGTSSYNNAANWDIGVVPLNDATNLYNVILPGSKGSILFDVAVGPSQITDLNVGANTILLVPGGRSLTVLEDLTLRGTIQGDGQQAVVSAPGPGILDLNFSFLKVSGGADLALDHAMSYRFDGDRGNYSGSYTILSADRDRFDARPIQRHYVQRRQHTLNGGSYTYSVVAANGGVVDLSEVTTLTGAASDDWLRLRATPGGTILLGKVPQTTGRVWFDIDDTGTLDLAALQAVAGGGQFTLGTGATLALPELLAINGGTFSLGLGASFNVLKNSCR